MNLHDNVLWAVSRMLSAIFSQMLICYSWEYALTECTLHFEFEGYRRIKFENPRVLLLAIWCKCIQIHAFLKTVIAPYAWRPQILFHILKANELGISIHAWFWPIGCCDVIILASELLKKIYVFFIDDVMIFFVQLKLSRLVVINFLPNFDML